MGLFFFLFSKSRSINHLNYIFPCVCTVIDHRIRRDGELIENVNYIYTIHFLPSRGILKLFAEQVRVHCVFFHGIIGQI